MILFRVFVGGCIVMIVLGVSNMRWQIILPVDERWELLEPLSNLDEKLFPVCGFRGVKINDTNLHVHILENFSLMGQLERANFVKIFIT